MLGKGFFLFFYGFFIRLYGLAARVMALWNGKARQWVRGRRGLFAELSGKLSPQDRIIWMHCASAGEFEQGKPVIEALKQRYPHHKVLVSFFSPSGYAAGLKYALADLITYLPEDTRGNARRFQELVRPHLAVFVKYEFWYHHLSAAAARNVPVVLVSGIFRKDQLFFAWYGGFYRKLLFLFRHLFVQDQASLDLLARYQVRHASIGGDTRFDRVKKIAESFTELEAIKEYAGNAPLLVAGSTWPDDEKLLSAYSSGRGLKLIIAPHEIHASHLSLLRDLFPQAMLYSELKKGSSPTAPVLIIDNMGLLSRLYRYATVTYIGGGFNKSGIHNTLEAAVYGKPVLFGPNYQKFKEARDLMEAGGAFSFSMPEELKIKMDQLLDDPEHLLRAGAASAAYVQQQTGATAAFLDYIQENRLLTS